jgi:prepilin-type N-terminal cleavage/methylation domain-containing protein/prepilin-type processing-associated H-X9-DG protein
MNKKIASSLRQRSGAQAFTLIELLTVIAIIGILAGIMIPVVGRVRTSANSISCASNLRQIGTAIQLYADENKNRLPNPTWSGIQVQFSADPDILNTSDPVRYNLFTHLAPYLVNFTGTGAKRFDSLACPAWRRIATDLTKPCYLARDEFTRSDGSSFRPWGNASNGTPASTTHHDIETPSTTWAIKDMDKKNFTNAAANYYDSLPNDPVHGDHRNQLYFDWHVAKAKTN